MDGLVLFVVLPIDRCYLNTSVQIEIALLHLYCPHLFLYTEIVLFLGYKNLSTSFQYDIQGWGGGG